MRKLFLSFVAPLALAVLALLPARVVQAADPTILAVTYASPDANIHLGSQVTVYMSAIIATQQLNLSVTAGSNATSINLAGTDLISIVIPQTLYVTDGQRVWGVNFSGGGATNFSFGDSQLLANTSPFQLGATYGPLANQTFRVYAGTLINGLTPGINTFSVDVGAFDSVALGDSGLSNDVTPFDGIWSAIYSVPELGYIVSGSNLYGNVLYGSTPAVNQPFQSPQTITLDALRPKIETVLFGTNRSNYKGLMYLSSLSQGTSTPNPTNAQGRFDITVNKRDTVVDVEIVSASNKTLGPLVFPSNAASTNGWRVWDGRRGDGIFIADGRYTVNMYIRDINGVVGMTKTTQVSVVSMRYELSNIRITPSVLNSQPPMVNGILTALQADIKAYNDSNSSLRTSLEVLGWDIGGSPVTFGNHADYRSTVWGLQKIDFLNASGSSVFGITGTDGNQGYDDDISYLVSFAADPRVTPPDCYGVGFSYAGTTSTLSATANVGDSLIANDYTNAVFQELTVTGGLAANPTLLSAPWGVQIRGDTPSEGSYRLQLRTILNGIEFIAAAPPDNPDIPDPCGGSTTPAYRGSSTHFYPDSEPNGNHSANRGLGIFAEDTSVILPVNASQVPVLDSTPPYLLTSNPQDSSLVAPNTYSSTNRFSVQLKDDESTMNTAGSATYIRIIDPLGGFVLGTSTTNGGAPGNQITVYFSPNTPIKTGGAYTMQVNACNSGGLCIQKNIAFIVQDQTPPSVAAVELVPQVGANINLSINQSASEGPFENVKEVLVTLSMPSTSANTIDWVNSNTSLYQIVSGSRVPVPMTRVGSGTPTNGKLRYTINSVINFAGNFETETQTFSQDASSQSFSGPPVGTVHPRFFTTVCNSCLTILYSNNPSASRPALSGLLPLTITSQGSAVTSLQALLPNISALPADILFTRLNPAADQSQAVQFNVGTGPLLTPLVFTTANPLNIKLYYNDSDIGTGVVESDLRVRGFDGASWQNVTAIQDSAGTTGNTFTITPPSASAAYSVYAIVYPASTSVLAGVPTATALAFKSTRSFSPTNANPVYRKARFYYSETVPKEIDVKIYDTGGSLIKSLSLGSGIVLGNTVTDPSTLRTSYYFEWDGRNDNGDAVKNGLYLVRYRVTATNGNVDTQVKPVALIK